MMDLMGKGQSHLNFKIKSTCSSGPCSSSPVVGRVAQQTSWVPRTCEDWKLHLYISKFFSHTWHDEQAGCRQYDQLKMLLMHEAAGDNEGLDDITYFQKFFLIVSTSGHPAISNSFIRSPPLMSCQGECLCATNQIYDYTNSQEVVIFLSHHLVRAYNLN